MSVKAIEVNELAKYYGKQCGIENVSFKVENGEIFGFIGPNGSGKTTTIRTLLALIHPTSGSASIFGRDCIREADKIAGDVGYLPTETYYYENMTALELLQYTADLYRVNATDHISELAGKINLDLKRKISSLSYGNKKKVGIIASLLHQPKMLILDEPTSGLDPIVQQTFIDILKEENKKGMTVLFSSHVLSDVQKVCSRVAILKEGRVIDIQNISELREKGFKKVELNLIEPVPPGLFEFEGVADFRQSNNQISFIYHGDLNLIVEKIALLKLNDIFIEEPTLEEIFFHYYE
ncbi:MAG: ABC transporter ATP-binding protein [Bacillota bacterium]